MVDQAPTYSAPSYAGVSSYGLPQTPAQMRAQLAMSMIREGTDSSPIRSKWQGAARLAQALMGGLAYQQMAQPNRDLPIVRPCDCAACMQAECSGVAKPYCARAA